MATERRAAIHDRLRRLLELPMLVASAGFLVVILWPAAQPHLSPAARHALTAADYGLWAAFAAEYLVLLATAPSRWLYVRKHPFDLIIVLVPFLRPLRLARLLRFARLVAVASSVGWRSRSRFLSTAALGAAGVAAVLVAVIAVAVLDVERAAPNANIRSFGDALWWAATTVTTVGYGDHYPVTATGRLMAVVLMVSGIALLGVITAAVAAWFVGLTQADARGRDRVDVLAGEVRELRAAIERLATKEAPHA